MNRHAPVVTLHIVERVLPYRGQYPYGVVCGCGFVMLEEFRTYAEAARIVFEHDQAHRFEDHPLQVVQ